MILDIKTLAESLIQDVWNAVQKLEEKPHLTIIMVGNNSASEVYVRNKIKTCESVGIQGTLLHLPETISQTELAHEIQKLNTDNSVHGILVQSPLPSHIEAQEIFDIIDAKKDVDGFSNINTARLYSGDESGLVPGTPKGVMKIIENYFQKLQTTNHKLQSNKNSSLKIEDWRLKIEGKHAVVIGKSTIVGKPLAMLLLHAGATVTVCHSRTKDLSLHTKNADIIISAVGKKHLITADMVKPWSLVVDVGINVENADGGRKLFGDCDTESINNIADITPVPGGVGPMTIALLLSNVLTAYQLQWKQ
jgi:methylenetetrahydrofolate dehydrogenase (NADP+) / methenyltetrahydrofolate cyclohydrolase